MDNEDASLLVVLMDTSPIVWSGSASVTGSPSPSPAAADSPMAESAEATPTATSSSSAQPATTPSGRGIVGRGFADTVSQLCSFINAFLLLNAKNRLAVIACHAWESRYIFPTVEEPDAPDETPDRLVRTRSALLHQISLLPSVVPSSATSESSVLSSALSLALCYINRITRVSPTLKPRILCLNASPDISAQYIPVMNCIFAAQRKGILIDTCILGDQHSAFLQQASDQTGGIYIMPTVTEGLLQYLLSAFLADSISRKSLKLPKLTSVDYRASCFCHKTAVDTGFVCSVCLSIFCKFTLACSTCGTKFPLPGTKPMRH